MGHDIVGFNKAGEEIAYARFSMWNRNAIILYSILGANAFYAGVSGSGKTTTFSTQQIQQAFDAYNELCNSGHFLKDAYFLTLDKKQILDFIQNCLTTAQLEENVKVYFG